MASFVKRRKRKQRFRLQANGSRNRLQLIVGNLHPRKIKEPDHGRASSGKDQGVRDVNSGSAESWVSFQVVRTERGRSDARSIQALKKGCLKSAQKPKRAAEVAKGDK